MNCRDCLQELATGSLRELTPDSPVSRHAGTCPDCGPLLTQLRDREYAAATTLNNLAPLSNPITVAETAGRLSRRRRLGGVGSAIAGVALALSIWFAADTVIPDLRRVASRQMPVLFSETLPLSCLSPDQAGEIVEPYLRSHGSAYYTAPGVAVITLRATSKELAAARNVLKEFDNDRKSSCHVSLGATFDKLYEKLSDVQSRPVLAGEKATPGNRNKPAPTSEKPSDPSR